MPLGTAKDGLEGLGDHWWGLGMAMVGLGDSHGWAGGAWGQLVELGDSWWGLGTATVGLEGFGDHWWDLGRAMVSLKWFGDHWWGLEMATVALGDGHGWPGGVWG